jgi:uncharacterized protein
MPDMPNLTLSLHAAIDDIDADDWNACAGAGNPFVSHAFLACVEESGSTGKRTGWLPQHAALRDRDGVLVGCAPMYGKSHSYGEYVFDHAWANAFERAGGDYYPKLQIASPFSPVPGPRFLIRPDGGAGFATMGAAVAQACGELGLSSVHATFCTEAEWEELGEAGWLQRLGMQFHWQNQGYACFDDFLGAMSSRKRKTLRRERRDAQSCGLEFVTLRGPEITRAQWRDFYRFYTSTVDRKWGSAYLTQDFFTLLGQRLGEQVVLMLALEHGKPVAGALNLMGSDALYGRNWGCDRDYPFLHFELCYYRALDFAIENGLARVEAGAQGQHKIQRGYLPAPTYSVHWIRHRGLHDAVADFLVHERAEKLVEMEELAELGPYKRGDDE